MIRTFCCILILATGMAHAQDETLRQDLERTYQLWRHSLQTRNDMVWRKVTAPHRQVAVKNRLLSEKKRFPQDIFNLPALPPSLDGLQHLSSKRRGPTAKAYYYGKIDFGLGGNPSENLLVVSYVGAAKAWRFDQLEYINLAIIPEVKQQLAAGDLKYIETTPELQPSGTVPHTPAEVKEAPFIAKVYVYCPGREVRVQINQISKHTFSNAQQAEIVMGGARPGINHIQYAIKDEVPEAENEPMTIRVYLMSEVQGVKPIKAYEYQVEGGKKPVGFGKATFDLDEASRRTLLGR